MWFRAYDVTVQWNIMYSMHCACCNVTDYGALLWLFLSSVCSVPQRVTEKKRIYRFSFPFFFFNTYMRIFCLHPSLLPFLLLPWNVSTVVIFLYCGFLWWWTGVDRGWCSRSIIGDPRTRQLQGTIFYPVHFRCPVKELSKNIYLDINSISSQIFAILQREPFPYST